MKNKTTGYLGPMGTFSEQAALDYNSRKGFHLREYPSIAAVISAVGKGELDEGIVPLDNILEGGVAATLEHLVVGEGIFIRQEMYQPIRQCLMAEERVEAEKIEIIYSHPHALGQCAAYLDTHYPGARSVPVESTAAAAKIVTQKLNAGAIAPKRAAEIFGLRLLAEGVEDAEDNFTRFVVIGRQDHPPTGQDKTSLVLSVSDGPGKLYEMLGYFARRNINLTRIESRPSRRILGDWLFYIDCEGHRLDEGRASLWKEVEVAAPFFKLLGSYPCGKRPC